MEGGGSDREIISYVINKGSTRKDKGGGERGEKEEGTCGDEKLGEGGGPSEGVFRGGDAGRGGHVTGSGPDPQGERVLPWHWTC